MLFIELKLPPTGDPSAPVPPVKTLGPARRGGLVRSRGKQQFSTSKEILEKLKKLHPLPGMILEWRRISCALSKVNDLKTQPRKINQNLEFVELYVHLYIFRWCFPYRRRDVLTLV